LSTRARLQFAKQSFLSGVIGAPRCSGRVAGISGWVLGCLVLASVATAREPAVKASNGRVAAFYEYTHVDSEDAFRFPATGTPVLEHISEVDIDEGGVRGTYTMPLGDALGLRFIAGTAGSKTHPDVSAKTKTAGLDFGGDIFLRDPEVFELGIGPRYVWTDLSRGSTDRTIHSAGAAAYGKYFLQDFRYGPVDLDLSGEVLDSDIDRDSAFPSQRTFIVAGGARLYFSDAAALRLGGRWSRSNFEGGGNIITGAADIDLDILLPFKPNVTLGAGLSIGHVEQSQPGLAQFGRPFFSLGISATVSFPGADSLVELNRFYY
jgi:hypothetical protein